MLLIMPKSTETNPPTVAIWLATPQAVEIVVRSVQFRELSQAPPRGLGERALIGL